MPTKPLISVGQLIDDSWDTYRSRIVEYLTVSSWLLITAILYVVALAFYPAASKLQFGAGLSGLEVFGIYLYALTTFIIAPIITFWLLASLTRLASNHLSRKKVDHKTALREGKEVFLSALLTTVMVFLMMVLAAVIGFGPPALIVGIGELVNVGALVVFGTVLLVLGTLVALVLAVRWMGYYFFGPIETMIDGAKGKAALEISRDLVKGRLWGVLARIIVPKLVFIIFGAFAMSIIAYLVSALIDASAGFNLDLQLRIATMTQSVVPILIVIVLNPLVVISDVLLFRSLKASR